MAARPLSFVDDSSVCSRAEFLHHGGELLEGDLTVAVSVDLLDDVVNRLLGEGLAEGQDFLNLRSRDVAGAVLK